MGHLTLPVALELNQRFKACWEEGVTDAVGTIASTYSLDSGNPMGTVLDMMWMDTSDTTKNVYAYPGRNFELYDFGAGGDMSVTDVLKMYQQTIESGGYKGKRIEIPLVDFNDDLIGQWGMVFYNLGRTQAWAPLRLAEKTWASLDSLVSTVTDVPVLSVNRPRAPKEAGSPLSPNIIVQAAGMTFDNFGVMWSKFITQPDEAGVAAEDNIPTHLWFDPDYMGMALDICYMQKPSGLSGGENPWRGKVRPVPIRKLAGTGRWGLSDATSQRLRPATYVEREPLLLEPLYTNPGETWVRDNRKVKWQVMGRITAGPGYPYKIMESRKS